MRSLACRRSEQPGASTWIVRRTALQASAAWRTRRLPLPIVAATQADQMAVHHSVHFITHQSFAFY